MIRFFWVEGKSRSYTVAASLLVKLMRDELTMEFLDLDG